MGLFRGALLGYLFDNRRASKEQGQALEDALDKRPREANFKQLAGEACAACARRIIAHKEALACPTCAQPIHHACAERHAATCGAPTPPYR